MKNYIIAGVVAGAILAVAPVPSNANQECTGRWADVAPYLIGQRIHRLHVDKYMTVSKNACADYSHARYVLVRNPNGNLGKTHHLR